MIYRSKAPLRLGLAGGGTDVSPYSDMYGGAILNVTISLFAYTTIEPCDNGKITFVSPDVDLVEEYDSTERLDTGGFFILAKGVYNRIVKDYTHKPLSFRITSHVDVPAGGGLGTSSTLVVSILGAFIEWLKLPLGEYDIARLAYEIERVDLGLLGGKQDQYAATFGGFNYMQFSKENQVLVNPLRIKANYQTELAHNLLLFYTQTSHVSAEIIKGQVENMQQKNADAMEAMHLIKRQTELMKEVLLRGEIDKIGDILNLSWEQKKKTAQHISNPLLEDIYKTALKAGATGGKISGAGGGGFMFFYCPNVSRYTVERELVKNFKGEVKRYEFTQIGLETWTI